MKKQIVNRLGYLPLAVKLAGAQLQRRPPDRWLQTFDIRKLKSQRVEDVHDDLELTFQLSLEELSKEDRSLYCRLSQFHSHFES